MKHWLTLDQYVFWVAEVGEELVAYGDVDERPGLERYWLDLRAVDAAGAASLLEAAEQWAARRAGPHALVHTSTASSDEAAGAALEAAGHRLVRFELEMRIELDEEPPEPTWPSGLAVRTFHPGEDDEEAWRADMDSFADHWEFTPDPFESWRKEVLGHPGFDPSLFFLAAEGDAIAGLSYCLLRDLGERVGWVQILGVRSHWRRRGSGSRSSTTPSRSSEGEAHPGPGSRSTPRT